MRRSAAWLLRQAATHVQYPARESAHVRSHPGLNGIGACQHHRHLTGLRFSHRSDKTRASRVTASGVLAAVGVVGFCLYAVSLGKQPLYADASSSHPNPKSDPKKRKIRLSEIKQHGTGSKDGVWVSRGTNVYDITEWIENHPGGSVILRAAGGALEPYWSVFAFHSRPDILATLEEFCIGEVDPRDLVDGKVPADAIDDPFADDPQRDTRLIQRTQKPCNAETPSSELQQFVTPTEVFFTRNHLWVPQAPRPEEWELSVELPDGSTKVYTLADLRQRFSKQTITATLQCSGNRRSHMTANSRASGLDATSTDIGNGNLTGITANGLQWDAGAISNAEWTGVRLRDVLRDAGVATDNLPEYAKHCQFYGAEGYGASIPMHKACDPSGDVLLAFEMNGKPIPPDHGAPLRVLAPGNVAARSVKWVSRISIAEEESTSQWQRRDYKCFGPNVGSNPNWERAMAIQELPVQSAITSIEEFSTQTERERTLLRNYGLEEDFVKICGYAFSGGGRGIQRVDVSVDGGGTWKQAKLEANSSKGSRQWSWTLWTHMVPKGYVGREIVVKAVDESYNTQPESYEANWNFRGNLTTAWHRVPRPAFKN